MGHLAQTNSLSDSLSKSAEDSLQKNENGATVVNKHAAINKHAPINKHAALNKLLKSQDIWRASGTPRQETGIATGYRSLDNLFAGGGWPTRGLTEILHDQPGVGELRLLTPALAKLSQTQNRWLLWVAPPYIPYAPALSNAGVDLTKLLIVNPEHQADRLWVLEKALASSSCSAVIAWPGQMTNKQLRRLQVASKNGHCLGVLYRHSRAASMPSPAELRVRLYARPQHASAVNDHSQLALQILKRKGGWATDVLSLELQDQLGQTTPDFSELPVQQWHQGDPDLVYMDPPAKGHAYVLQ